MRGKPRLLGKQMAHVAPDAHNAARHVAGPLGAHDPGDEKGARCVQDADGRPNTAVGQGAYDRHDAHHAYSDCESVIARGGQCAQRGPRTSKERDVAVREWLGLTYFQQKNCNQFENI